MALIDKETIRKEIERRTYNAHEMPDSRPDKQFYEGKDVAYGEILGFLDTMEQPVEDLDKARLLEVLDQWEEHAIRGMRNGATAYHQGKIALITDLRDWINGED